MRADPGVVRSDVLLLAHVVASAGSTRERAAGSIPCLLGARKRRAPGAGAPGRGARAGAALAGAAPTRGVMVAEAQAVRACAGCVITSGGYHHGYRETHDGRRACPPARARHAICRRTAPAHAGLPDYRGAPAGVARLPG